MLKKQDYSGGSAFNGQTLNGTLIDSSESGKGKRDKNAITIGYFLTNSLSLFIGYRDTKLENSEAFEKPKDGESIPKSEDIEEDGFFAGASYGWYIESLGGAISIKGGVAYQDWKLEETAITLFTKSLTKYESSGWGGNAGIGWNSSLSENSSYFINADYYKYKYDKVNEADINNIKTIFQDRGLTGFDPTSSMWSVKVGFNIFF